MASFFTLKNMTFKHAFLALSVSTLLSACGGSGGGGSSANTSSNTSPSANTTTPPTGNETTNPITTTPTETTATNATPANGSVEQTIIAALNAKRTQCGFGGVQYDSELTKAAANHANYLGYISEKNKTDYGSHNEGTVSGLIGTGTENPYYTGFSVSDRVKTPANKGNLAQAVNYNYTAVAENISLSTLTTVSTTVDAASTSQTMLNSLLAAPYHMRGLVSPSLNQVGVNYSQTTWQNTNNKNILSLLELVSAAAANQAQVSNASLLTYPCGGSENTEYELTDETPNPIPGRDLQANPVGQPIYILAPANKTIQNIEATIATQNGMSASNLTMLTREKDPNKILKANEAFIIPETALQPLTKYTVTYRVTYTTGEIASNKFDFSTKAKV